MLIICINSFNSTFYVDKATSLLNDVFARVPDAMLLVAVGGCSSDIAIRNGRTLWVNIRQNLSDHNVYPAFKLSVERKMWEGVELETARFVMLHDTCVLGPTFAMRMHKLESHRKCEWAFAHTYGLYNIGLASYTFMLRRAEDWDGVFQLDKNIGIRLEQGCDQVVQEKMVPSLHSYSNMTLAQMSHACDDPDSEIMHDLDHFTINSYESNGERRFVSYIAAFGIYKPFAAKTSFFAPILAHPSHTPSTAAELHELRMQKWNVQMNRGSVWIPLLSLV